MLWFIQSIDTEAKGLRKKMGYQPKYTRHLKVHDSACTSVCLTPHTAVPQVLFSCDLSLQSCSLAKQEGHAALCQPATMLLLEQGLRQETANPPHCSLPIA